MPRGSKPGERRGGRQRGTPNKKTALKNAALAAAAANTDISPRDFLLGIMRDPTTSRELRVKIALAVVRLTDAKPIARRDDPTQSRELIDGARSLIDAAAANALRDDYHRLNELFQKSLGPSGRDSASLQPRKEESDTSFAQPDASFTQANVDKAKHTETIFRDEYRKCLGAEANRMVTTNISTQEFSLFIKGACLAERNKYAVQLIEAISMTSDSPDDIAAVITSANNLIDQIQTAAVYQFTRRSGQ
jgi:hypothetical protein